MPNLLQKVRNALSGVSGSIRQFADREEVERTIGFGRIYSQVYHLVNEMDDYVEGIFYSLVDVFFDAGVLYAVIVSGGRLFRADIRIGNNDEISIGELMAVTQMFVPSTQRSFQTTNVFRTKDGRTRWLSISNTAVLNRVGELDSRALFDSFIAHAEETGEFPYRTIIHQGEVLRTGQADYLARDGYCYITSGLFDADSALAELEVAARTNNPERWGESIGFRATAQPDVIRVGDDISVPVYEAGVNIEISTCLEEDAAAWFTSSVITEVTRNMDGQVRSTIEAILDDAAVTDEAARQELMSGFETLVDSVNERATSSGVIARANKGKGASKQDDAADVVIDDSVIDAIVARISGDERFRSQDEVDLSALSNRLDQVVEQVEEVVGRMDTAEGTINKNFEEILRLVDDATAELEAEVERNADMPPQQGQKIVYRPSAERNDEGDEEPIEEPPGLKKIPAYPGATT